ncbi:MAG TPA: hypothetical protein VG754_14480, partial [Verrucomicrobiae bacterium]|nr:hypothetical protein [Verrucomicrobiae bacterium]
MKANRNPFTALMVMLFLVLLTCVARAASDIHFGPTGSETGVNNPDGLWQNDWGPASAGITFDAANPPLTGDTSGSIYVQGNWTGNTGGWDNYNIVVDGNNYYHNASPIFNGGDYTNLEFDIKYDTNSTLAPASAAHLDVGIDHSYGNTVLQTLSFDTASSPLADGNWHHVSIPIAASQTGINNGYGVGFYEWNPGGTMGTMNYWVANV